MTMSLSKLGRNDPCLCGSGKKYKQCCLARQAAPRASVSLDVRASQQLALAFTAYQAGKQDEAQATCEALLRQHADQQDVLHLLALIQHAQGQGAQALSHIDRAITRAPNYSMHSNRGLILQALGRQAEAVEAFRRALAEQPGVAPTELNLGNALTALQRWSEALEAYRRCVALDPRNVAALNGMGSSALNCGDHDLAERSLRQALAVDPVHIEAWINLGSVLWGRGEMDAGLEAYREALRLDPGHLLALRNLGEALLNQSRVDEARAVFDEAWRRQPGAELRIRRDLMLPFVNDSREAMLASRGDFERRLDALIADCEPVAEPSPEIYCSSAFKLAFHGEDDLPLMRKLAAFYSRICPELLHEAPHVKTPAQPGARRRIGFFSVNVHDHSVARCFAQLMCRLAEDERFEIVLISTQDPAQARGIRHYEGFRGRMLRVSPAYREARAQIEALGLDILVYQDIGMDALSYFLAFARLARAQCVMGGHPVTTGIPTMDYVVSTTLGEPADAASHYSEKLLLLAGLPVVFKHPELPERLKTRAELDLPEQGRLYLCPMMLQKMHPDFDAAIAGILERDPQGHVVLFKHPHARWEEQLGARFAHSIPAALRERLHFHRWLHDYGDFIAANAAADVVIDPFHFGIGSTVIATFAVGTPIVSWPGRYLRGRVGLAYCRLLELDECIASDPQDYIARAVAIASDAALRQRLHERILARKSRLFDNEQPVRDLAELFAGLAQSLALKEEVL